MRTTICTVAEDESNLDLVDISFDSFQALSDGYLRMLNEYINDTEREYLPFSGRYITLELSSRFLADYILGDVYFKAKRKDHNLDSSKKSTKIISNYKRKFKYNECIY